MTPKTIRIKSLSLENFKGIRKLNIEFGDRENFIRGGNATGKTTIMDAYTYLLYGKDSLGRADFNIKTLDNMGEPLHGLEHTVSAVLVINDTTVSLKKVYKEKWTKPRGQQELVFSGHETIYFYNEVPLAQKDYNTKIELICPEKIFKLLTNPHYFPGLNWTEQRQMLIGIAGEITDTEIASSNKAYSDLLASLKGQKTVAEYKREIVMKKKRINEQLDEIPARMDEVQKQMPEALNWEEIRQAIQANQKELDRLDGEIADQSKGSEGLTKQKLELQNAIGKKKLAINAIEMDADHHINNLKYNFEKSLRARGNDIKDLDDIISRSDTKIGQLQESIARLKGTRETKIQEWHKINDETFNIQLDTNCPTCGQQFPDETIAKSKEDALAKFNTAKANRLQYNVSEGKKIAAEILDAEKAIEAAVNSKNEAKKQLDSLNSQVLPEPDYGSERANFLASKNYEGMKTNLAEMESQYADFPEIGKVDTSALEKARTDVRATLDSLKKDLTRKDYIDGLSERLTGLKNDQIKYSQELSDYEKAEFIINGFERARIDAIETQINGMFQIVRFRMFDAQINGGEKETCECTVDGVPYSDLNNAMKINAGLDILSTLSDKYGVSAPVFIDNRESVNDLLPISSQLINLVVTTHKELTYS